MTPREIAGGLLPHLAYPAARIAMRETLLMAAEAWQAGADYEKDADMQAVADWLKEQADANG